MSRRYRDWDDEVEADDRRGAWQEWQQQRWSAILDDEAARNRRLLDEDERRCDGLFDRDREYQDFEVRWPDNA